MITTKYADIVFSLILIGLSVAALFKTTSLTSSAAMVPRFTLGVLILLSLIQIFISAISHDKKTLHFDLSRIMRILLIAIIYVIIIPLVGYYIASVLYLISMMYSFGIRKRPLLAIMPAVFCLFAFIVFEKLLSINFPLPFFIR